MKMSKIIKSKLVNKVTNFPKFLEKLEKYDKRYLIYIKHESTYSKKGKW